MRMATTKPDSMRRPAPTPFSSNRYALLLSVVARRAGGRRSRDSSPALAVFLRLYAFNITLRELLTEVAWN